MVTFFGNSELLLRLPNLLSFLIYLTYSYLFFRDKPTVISVTSFAFMTINIMLVNLFGLARGYGLSIAFGLASIYHITKLYERDKLKDLLLFHFMALLACLSNFTLITVYVASITTYILLVGIRANYTNETVSKLKQIVLQNILPFTAVFLIMYEPVRRLLTESSLDFGGTKGFFNSTISHHIIHTINTQEIPDQILLLQIIFTALALTPTILIIKNLLKKDEVFFTQHLRLIFSNFLLVIICSIIIAQHYILGTDYPINRFSMYLFPLYMLQFGFFMNYLTETKYKKAALITSITLFISLSISFVSNADLYQYTEWEYESNTKELIKMLHEDASKNQLDQVRLGIDWIFEPTINYYIERDELDWLLPVDREGINESDDYFYIEEIHLNKLANFDCTILQADKKSETILLKNNNPTEIE